MFLNKLLRKLVQRDMDLDGYIEYITKKMFEIANAKNEFSMSYVKTPDWFLRDVWKLKQQNEYIDWLVSDLRSMKLNKRDSVKFANEYVWQYGFKLEKE